MAICSRLLRRLRRSCADRDRRDSWLFFGVDPGRRHGVPRRLPVRRQRQRRGAASFWAIAFLTGRRSGGLAERRARRATATITLDPAVRDASPSPRPAGAGDSRPTATFAAVAFFGLLGRFSGGRAVVDRRGPRPAGARRFGFSTAPRSPPPHRARRGRRLRDRGHRALRGRQPLLGRPALDRGPAAGSARTSRGPPRGRSACCRRRPRRSCRLAFLAWGIRTRRRSSWISASRSRPLSLVDAALLRAPRAALGAPRRRPAAALHPRRALAQPRRCGARPGGERAGFTARPLFAGRGALQAAAVVAGLHAGRPARAGFGLRRTSRAAAASPAAAARRGRSSPTPVTCPSGCRCSRSVLEGQRALAVADLARDRVRRQRARRPAAGSGSRSCRTTSARRRRSRRPPAGRRGSGRRSS